MRPEVGFNWNNGRLLSVTVIFPTLPAAPSIPDLAAATRDAVAAGFKQTPDKLIFGFEVQASR
jgi:hypothetical protein